MNLKLLPLLALLFAACSSPASAPVRSEPELLPVSLPDLSNVDEAVRVQANERHAALLAAMAKGAGGEELGTAYGDLGMMLHAAEYFEAAEPCYRNARTLMPADTRWPYYLAMLYQSLGRAADAERAFARVIELRPDDVPALLRLGRMYLDRGDAAAAEPLFARARAADPRSVAALAGLGQAALAARQYERAAQHLEQGLALQPTALSLHAPLANAYRALGRPAEAEAHLKQWRNTELPLPDPYAASLDALVESGLAYEIRGVRAMSAERWTEAAALFRKGIALEPEGMLHRSLRHKLGTVLWMAGDARGAIAEFERVAAMAPPDGLDEPASRAHYSLGIVKASDGDTRRALEHLQAAVRYGPDYGEAHFALAELLRGAAGRPEDALPHYEAAVRINPGAARARFGRALAFVMLGRYVEARDVLDEAVRIHPDRPELRHALARVLAAAPDARARDGQRALALLEQVAATTKTLEVGETLAMALAEVGAFEKAVALQRDVLETARRAGIRDTAFLADNLARYERREACRTPWNSDNPIFRAAEPE